MYGFTVSMLTVSLSHQNVVGYSSGKQMSGVREDSWWEVGAHEN